MPSCTVELFLPQAGWVEAGEVHVTDQRGGYGSPGRFEYAFDFLDAHPDSLGAVDARAVSCRFPPSYEVYEGDRWPAFLLDIIPSGAARRFWERELGVPNTSTSDWTILTHGAGNPPGNVRIREAVQSPITPQPGFTKDEVVARAAGFLEYARERGAEVAGASGAGGDSPKLLLREDFGGRFHADGALDDDKTARCWLVKFPREPRTTDRMILEAEAAYHRIARRFGVRTGGDMEWTRDCLFVPRFDRIIGSECVERLGLESLYSLAGVTDFGVPVAKEAQVEAIRRFATDAAAQVEEFLLRDVLDVALGNTDNHARNTAVLKEHKGRIALSPLYDFAPMFLDTAGIARVCRWREEVGGYPRWPRIAASTGIDAGWLERIATRVDALPGWLVEERVPERVREAALPRIERVARDLREDA